jgi:hypothetical protein
MKRRRFLDTNTKTFSPQAKYTDWATAAGQSGGFPLPLTSDF